MNRSPKAERGLRKPIPERKGGQFFGTADDEPYDDAFTGESLVSQQGDPESGDPESGQAVNYLICWRPVYVRLPLLVVAL